MNGKPEGKGRLNFMNEMYYEGKFKEGNLDGQGFFFMKGIAEIKGMFKKNQLNGVDNGNKNKKSLEYSLSSNQQLKANHKNIGIKIPSK